MILVVKTAIEALLTAFLQVLFFFFVTLLMLHFLTDLDRPHQFARPKEDSTGIQDPQGRPANVQTDRTKAFFTSGITTKTQRQFFWQSAAATGAALAGNLWPSAAAGLTGRGRTGRPGRPVVSAVQLMRLAVPV